MFNQKEYWSNRRKGKRGQEDTKPKKNMVVQAKPEHTIQVGYGLIKVSRKVARKREIDRTYTQKGYKFGKKIKVKR